MDQKNPEETDGPPTSGDENEGEQEEEAEEEEEEEPYDSEDYISHPYLSENSTLPENIVSFDYSFGYDCKRYFNLCVVDKEVLIFASGNLIHIFNTRTGEKSYRRCFSGEGIGHITVSTLIHRRKKILRLVFSCRRRIQKNRI